MIKYLKSNNVAYQSFSLVLAIFSFLTIALISPAMAQEQVLRTLTVTGRGTERIPATLAEVRLGVEIQAKTAAEAQQEVAKRTSAVVDFLRSRQVARLKTDGIRLRPNYNFNDRQRRLIGYVGTNIVSFRLQTEQVGSLLDKVVAVGATRIDSVSFTATEEEIASAQKEALRKATTEAQQQADAVLESLNFDAKEIISIQINGASLPEPQILQRGQAALSAAEDSTPVVGGEQAVSGSVTLQISY